MYLYTGSVLASGKTLIARSSTIYLRGTSSGAGLAFGNGGSLDVLPGGTDLGYLTFMEASTNTFVCFILVLIIIT